MPHQSIFDHGDGLKRRSSSTPPLPSAQFRPVTSEAVTSRHRDRRRVGPPTPTTNVQLFYRSPTSLSPTHLPELRLVIPSVDTHAPATSLVAGCAGVPTPRVSLVRSMACNAVSRPRSARDSSETHSHPSFRQLWQVTDSPAVLSQMARFCAGDSIVSANWDVARPLRMPRPSNFVRTPHRPRLAPRCDSTLSRLARRMRVA